MTTSSAGDGPPEHPTGRAIALIVGVTVLIVVLAALSATGRI
jgi:hypothetical protein